VRKKAQTKRQEFLNTLVVAAKAMKDKARKQLIMGLKHAKETRKCFALVWKILQPSTPGGLTHLIIPDPVTDTPQIIQDTMIMENHLFKHSKEHVSQAHGTPYTVPPLSDLLAFDGMTPFGNAVFRGEPIPLDLPLAAATRLLLQHQCTLLLPTETPEHPFEFDLLMKGFRKWPEKTTTSPSGHHLGIYKSLLKDTPPPNPPPDYIPRTYGIDIMHDVYHIMKLALKHTHPLR